MSRPEGGIPQDLQDLVAAACDGELSDRDTEQLEQLLIASPEARQFYLLYMHLHGELHWHQAMAGEMPELAAPSAEGKGLRIRAPAVARPRPDQRSRLRLIGFCISAIAAITLLVLAYRIMPQRKRSAAPAPPVAVAAARLTGGVQPRWGAGSAPPAIGQEIPMGRLLVLERGVVEISHPRETRILVEGPSSLRYSPGGRIELDSGRIAIIASEKPDFVIQAGGATIEPAGGMVGVSVAKDAVEIHSLNGTAQIRQVHPQNGVVQETVTEVKKGEAVRWMPGSPPPPEPIQAARGRFVLALPDRDPSHSVARMREVVANHPRLIHHYTFEGTSRLEKCQDKRGAVHLTEAVMVGGRGRGSIDYTARGLDLTTEAIHVHREPQGGNENGTALQSEAQFRPPPSMTMELLLQYRVPDDAGDETVALAVATREGNRECGFYVAAVGKGHLSLLLDGEADWVEMGTVLTPEHWYYVAVTFKAGGTSTVVNAFVADLTGGEGELHRALTEFEVPGVPPTSRLGIGKGFDYTGAHAYPWSGELDEVAVYDTVLEAEELQKHMSLLQAGSSGSN